MFFLFRAFRALLWTGLSNPCIGGRGWFICPLSPALGTLGHSHPARASPLTTCTLRQSVELCPTWPENARAPY
ncbi:uncharacterized protein BKA78DRAFT_314066 [Phyllosticta capitalensis]|uniref:uncharacterized protein n=1 Tax=Phyllosticta capitalensis TaxID=121624 RepID=UPI00312F57BF